MSTINSLVTGEKISNSTRILWLFNTSVLSYLEILVILSYKKKRSGEWEELLLLLGDRRVN